MHDLLLPGRGGEGGSTQHNLTTAGECQTPPKCCEGGQRTGHSHNHSHSHSHTSAGCTASRDHKTHPATGGQTKPTVSKKLRRISSFLQDLCALPASVPDPAPRTRDASPTTMWACAEKSDRVTLSPRKIPEQNSR